MPQNSLFGFLPDKGIFEKFQINVTSGWHVCHCKATCMVRGKRSFALGRNLMDLKTLPPPTPSRSHPTLLSWSHSFSMAATVFHRDQGRAIRLRQWQLCVSWANHSQVGVWHGVETEPSLATHCSSTCESTGGRQNCFLVSFCVSVLFHPISCSTSPLKIRPVLLSPNAEWHTWHKPDLLYESWEAFLD